MCGYQIIHFSHNDTSLRHCVSPTADVLRWGKTYWQAASEHADRPKVDVEVDAKIEGSLAAEASLIVLDTLELLVQTLALEGQAMLGRTLEVLLHLMGSNQSTEVMRNIFATQRAIVSKFPELVFEDETELCAELCTRLLRHCSSDVAEVRALACSSIYLLMRQNYNELGSVSLMKYALRCDNRHKSTKLILYLQTLPLYITEHQFLSNPYHLPIVVFSAAGYRYI